RVRQTSFLKITFDEDLGDARLPPDVEMSCFRIVQESITNTLRHASARVLEVRITRASGQIGLSISDDGVGFDADRLGADNDRCGHFGLAGMRERVLGMQGRFAVITAPGLGCRIQVDIPVAPLTDQVAS
ncbi:MAG TPA: ATP-binding protein, partial [Bryobacteraceae bacterium]|nr:ATP-binding protein [Bryobacteraceae bacterium]